MHDGNTHPQVSVAPWIHGLFYFSFVFHTFLIQGDFKVMELRFSSAISPKLWQDSYFLKFKSLASSFLPLSPLLPPAWLGPKPRAKVSHPLTGRGGVQSPRSCSFPGPPWSLPALSSAPPPRGSRRSLKVRSASWRALRCVNRINSLAPSGADLPAA